MTPFMDDHPGGDEVLLSSTGGAKFLNYITDPMRIWACSMTMFCCGVLQGKMQQMILKTLVTATLQGT